MRQKEGTIVGKLLVIMCLCCFEDRATTPVSVLWKAMEMQDELTWYYILSNISTNWRICSILEILSQSKPVEQDGFVRKNEVNMPIARSGHF